MLTQFMAKLLASILAICASCYSATAQAPTTKEVNNYFERAIRSAAKSRQLAIDPQIARDMIEDISNFTFNFCAALPDECNRILGDSNNLQPILQQYLADVEGGAQSIETIASRLARSAGTDITKAGWPNVKPNAIGMVAVATESEDSVFYLRSGSGITTMGGPATKLLMQPGQWTVVVELANGSRSEKSVNVRARQTASLQDQSHASRIGRIEVKRSDYCAVTNVDQDNEVLHPYNFARAEFVGGIYSHAATVTQQVGISISVEDQTGLCGEECMQGMSAAFARALAIWRSGCARCTDNALAVMEAQGNIWLDRRAAARLRSFQTPRPNYSEVDLSQRSTELPFELGAVPAMTVPTKSSVGYEQINTDPELLAKLCGLSSPTGSDWIAIGQSLACGRRPSVERALKPHLVLTTASTPCGDAAIACGMPEGEVQITLKDFALRVPTRQGKPRIGTSAAALDVESVLLHEVGHWFGIPHPEAIGLKVEDIMSAVFKADKTCVSAQSLALLTNATDTRFEHRAKGNHGLTVDASSLTTDQESLR